MTRPTGFLDAFTPGARAGGLICILLCGLLAHSAYGQGNELVIVPNVHASELSGVVRFGASSEAFAPVSVIRFDGKSRVCLQFQTPGMNMLQMEVKRSKNTGELHPRLSVGT
jgi:hypothetical protein